MIATTIPDGVKFVGLFLADDLSGAAAAFRLRLAVEKGVGSSVVRVSEREIWVIADDNQAIRIIAKRGTGQ